MKLKKGITEDRRDEVIPDRLHIRKLAFELEVKRIKKNPLGLVWVV